MSQLRSAVCLSARQPYETESQPNRMSQYAAELLGLCWVLRKQHRSLLVHLGPLSKEVKVFEICQGTHLLILKIPFSAPGVSIHSCAAWLTAHFSGFSLTSWLHIFISLGMQCLFTKVKWVPLWACSITVFCTHYRNHCLLMSVDSRAYTL